MKHTKTWTIPDCPSCGREMQGVYHAKENSVSGRHPFGKPEGWWRCLKCGYESEKFDGKPYDNIGESEVTE